MISTWFAALWLCCHIVAPVAAFFVVLAVLEWAVGGFASLKHKKD